MIITKRIEPRRLYLYTKKNGWYLIATTAIALITALVIDPAHFKALSYPSGVIGTALAFMMATTALSFPEMVLLKKVVKVKLIMIFIAIVGTGILVVGYLFNYFL